MRKITHLQHKLILSNIHNLILFEKALNLSITSLYMMESIVEHHYTSLKERKKDMFTVCIQNCFVYILGTLVSL